VAAALERLPGVKSVKVSLEKAQARVEFDDAKISTDKLVAVINLLGFRARLLDVKRVSWGGAGIHNDRHLFEGSTRTKLAKNSRAIQARQRGGEHDLDDQIQKASTP